MNLLERLSDYEKWGDQIYEESIIPSDHLNKAEKKQKVKKLENIV